MVRRSSPRTVRAIFSARALIRDARRSTWDGSPGPSSTPASAPSSATSATRKLDASRRLCGYFRRGAPEITAQTTTSAEEVFARGADDLGADVAFAQPFAGDPPHDGHGDATCLAH